MGDNLKVLELRNGIVNLLNESNVPIEVKRLVLIEVKAAVEEECKKTIQAEIDEMNRKKEDNNGI